jgi:hypothetical protein
LFIIKGSVLDVDFQLCAVEPSQAKAKVAKFFVLIEDFIKFEKEVGLKDRKMMENLEYFMSSKFWNPLSCIRRLKVFVIPLC